MVEVDDSRRRNTSQAGRSILDWARLHLALIFGVALGAAAFAALITHQLAELTTSHPLAIALGVPSSLAILWLTLLAPGRPLHRRLTHSLGL